MYLHVHGSGCEKQEETPDSISDDNTIIRPDYSKHCVAPIGQNFRDLIFLQRFDGPMDTMKELGGKKSNGTGGKIPKRHEERPT